MNHFRPPLLIQRLFDNFIWSTSNNKILLTFDDGPTEAATMEILNILNANNIKSIFFCVGNNIKKNPELTERILLDGHTIGNHTMNHKLLTKMNRQESITELSAFNEMMKEKFSYNVKYFRPAHGKFNLRTKRLLDELKMKCVMWSLLTYDYENNLEKVKYSVDNYLTESSVIVFHDSLKCSNIIEESLNYTINQAVKRGFTFGEPEDCLK